MNVKTLWRYLACALFGAVIAVLVMKLTDTTDHPPVTADESPHEEHKEHKDKKADESHEEHEGHEEHEATTSLIKMSPEQLKANGIRVEVATITPLAGSLKLPGQLGLNADQEARVISPVSGAVREIRVQTGAQVEKGSVLAMIESQELAEANAAYLNAKERTALAQLTFNREQELWQKKISAEQDYLQAKRNLAENQIEERSSRQKLLALGLSDGDLQSLKSGSHLARYALRAPLAGTVLSKELTLGEALGRDKVVFRLANLKTLWVDLTVPTEALTAIKAGQEVQVYNSDRTLTGTGKVVFIQPELSTASRSGSVRVVIDNRAGLWRAGMFVTATLETEKRTNVLNVPASAVQTVEGKSVVFVITPQGLQLRPVIIGDSNARRLTIVSGLQQGEQYVADGSFILKSELQKGEAEHEH
ncbi:efflux RND transporter periplasmic adaptor subunit [Agitococcus lubricus]|uniref:Cobalt-zinc-cadmium efflux system membrane fusion protein n=1 Tax=Agitococcus lubricus TaxID=1077255 RepID=A0A2T5ITG6_9GAMM|nr:efflux RND transporter periplasmic adaptor subunit [Agitococcus lubricus]PTQ87160.1 cobalt-zinc-cadmium efflux system membrane fusion protein [Agitococcus lubricus]